MTGAAGFLGRRLVRRLLERGLEVRALVRRPVGDQLWGAEVVVAGDIAQAALPPLLAGCDIVINLAARVHVTRETAADPDQLYFQLNRDLPLALARSAHEAGAVRFVQMSSVAAIGSVTPPGQIFDDDTTSNPQNAYGRSKLAADEGLQALSSECGLSTISLRPPTVFGPGVGAYFRRLMNCARFGLPLPIGKIENARNFIFIDNLVDAVAAAAYRDHQGAFIVTDSPPISTAHLYACLLDAYERRAWVPRVPAGPVRLVARTLLGDRAESLLGSSAFDGSRFGATFGWTPPTSFAEAIAATVNADHDA